MPDVHRTVDLLQLGLEGRAKSLKQLRWHPTGLVGELAGIDLDKHADQLRQGAGDDGANGGVSIILQLGDRRDGADVLQDDETVDSRGADRTIGVGEHRPQQRSRLDVLRLRHGSDGDDAHLHAGRGEAVPQTRRHSRRRQHREGEPDPQSRE